MKKLLIISGLVLMLGACSTATDYNYEANSYAEYLFDLGDDSDLGFTKRALAGLVEEKNLLSEESSAIEDIEMVYVRLNEKEMSEGFIERRTWKEDVYDLKGTGDMNGIFQMFKNGELLFENKMNFGAEGPIQDWRIVDGSPAFTFYAELDYNENNAENSTSDIWYEGELISQKFSVENPRYLFSYKDGLGFVATKDGLDNIFYYNGSNTHGFITPGFSKIWTHNCCSYTEILPTVYDNGVLLFFGKRDEKNYIVETML